ncbi:histone H3-like centromeric protein cnp1 [Trichonephila inaurata madagascariensis]|uniref:Histone H3-like centromeric protein cnp1 n=1 Tax=Trichonephila inaurata madagascariensis TaxID=2747483 RepID=A0A8X6MHV7_9ARAC|nr:histone H3-like centromeric protein cnp1 [Trichonephila inaurata madagascariensis]
MLLNALFYKSFLHFSETSDEDELPETQYVQRISTPARDEVPRFSFKITKEKAKMKRKERRFRTEELDSKEEVQLHTSLPSTSRQADIIEASYRDAERLKRALKRKKQVRSARVNRRNLYLNIDREIRKLRKSTHLLVPKVSFSRVVKELCDRMTHVGLRWQEQALEALKECTEYYLVALFEDAQICAFHNGRSTIMKRDLQLAQKRNNSWGNFSHWIRNNSKRLNWPLSRVIVLYPGKDGIERVAKLRVANGFVIRPLQRIYPLEMSVSDLPSDMALGENFPEPNKGPEVPRPSPPAPNPVPEVSRPVKQTRCGRRIVPRQRLNL